MDSVIQPNTQFYVRNGHYTQYFIKDYLTGELVMVIYPDGKPEVRKIEEGITYKELNPNHEGTVYFMNAGLNPFSSTDFVTTTLGIYCIHLEDEFSSNFFKEEIKETKMSGNWDEIVAKIENLPTRTLKDLSQRSDALKEYDDKNFDLLRNEFLANVFGLPEGSLPEGEDVNTYEKDAHFSGSYSSDVLFTLPMGSWLHYQNRLVSLFGSMYEIKFYDDNNEESSRGLHIAYRLK